MPRRAMEAKILNSSREEYKALPKERKETKDVEQSEDMEIKQPNLFYRKVKHSELERDPSDMIRTMPQITCWLESEAVIVDVGKLLIVHLK